MNHKGMGAPVTHVGNHKNQFLVTGRLTYYELILGQKNYVLGHTIEIKVYGGRFLEETAV